jgi:hypothetical protein
MDLYGFLGVASFAFSLLVSTAAFALLEQFQRDTLERLENAIADVLPEDKKGEFLQILHLRQGCCNTNRKSYSSHSYSRQVTNPAPSTEQGNRALRCFYSPKIQKGQTCVVKVEFVPNNSLVDREATNKFLRNRLENISGFLWMDLEYAYVVRGKIYFVYANVPPMNGDVQKIVACFANAFTNDQYVAYPTVFGVKGREADYVFRLLEDEAKRSRSITIRTLYSDHVENQLNASLELPENPLTLTKMYKFLKNKVADLDQTLDEADGFLVRKKNDMVSVHRPSAEELAAIVYESA